jgi:hypothetical protein
MVGMGMGEQHRVQARDSGIQKLLAQIWRRVDKDDRAVVLDTDRRPQTMIARVGQETAVIHGAQLRHTG